MYRKTPGWADPGFFRQLMNEFVATSPDPLLRTMSSAAWERSRPVVEPSALSLRVAYASLSLASKCGGSWHSCTPCASFYLLQDAHQVTDRLSTTQDMIDASYRLAPECSINCSSLDAQIVEVSKKPPRSDPGQPIEVERAV